MRVPGPWELAIILAIVLVVFGAGRLPQIGSSLGRGMRAFRRGINGADDSFEETSESADKSENID